MISDSPTAEQAVTTKKGSPWSDLGRGLTNAEWEELKAWRNDNPNLVCKCREMRSDGRLFWGYSQPHSGGEKWITKETLAKLNAANKTEERSRYINEWKRRKYRSNKEHRENIKSQTRVYFKNNKSRANESKKLWWRKKYSTDPEFRKRALAKCCARVKRVGHYSIRDAYRRNPETMGDRALIRRIYRHAFQIKKRGFGNVEVDHIIPIRHDGAHHELNLQILPEYINRTKKDDPFWMTDGPYLDWRNVPRHLWPEKLRPEYERLIGLHPKPVHAVHVGFKGQPPICNIK